MASWQEVFVEVPDAPFGRGKDEGALTEAFESFVGGPERAFGLMRLYGRAREATSGNGYRLQGGCPTSEAIFRGLALRHGYTDEQATAYLDVR